MSNRDNWDLLVKYFENDCNESEKKEIQQLLISDTKFKKNLDQLKIIWESSEIQLPKPDKEKAWKSVKERINTEKFNQSTEQKNVKFSQWWINSKVLKIAAILLVFLTTAYFIYQTNSLEKIHYNEIVVAKTQTEKLKLSDGTQIILDSGSSLKYPQNFTEKSRKVYLNGEAYFKVAGDAIKPFIIYTEDSEVKVLGTEFNVRAWTNSEKVVVAVKEGKVAFKSNNSKSVNAEVEISGNQFSEMLKNNDPILPQETDISSFLQWQKREMYFRNVPLQEVFDQLKRWYDLEIEIQDKSIAINRVTIFLENKKINEILDVISLMNDLRYEKDGLNVVFSLSD